MSGHFDDDRVVVRTGAYGPHRCEHGTLLAFDCDLCANERWLRAEERRVRLQRAAPAPTPPADTRIQIGPLDV